MRARRYPALTAPNSAPCASSIGNPGSSGKEALAAAEEFAPDCILPDVMMPGMDGPSVLKALRQMPACAPGARCRRSRTLFSQEFWTEPRNRCRSVLSIG
ncbi:MAG: response regulator [Burkholderiales bacterium]|nr:response regulator [Burkholderiales bacterium]